MVEIIDRLKLKDIKKNKSDEFKPHFSSSKELLTYLPTNNAIDYRFENGRYIKCEIIDCDLEYEKKLLIHPSSQPLSVTKHNKYCFIYNEYKKLAINQIS